MSVLEELRRVEQQVLARLRELRPLVSEYEQLRHVAERLGLEVDESADGDAAKSHGGGQRSPAAERSSTAKRARGRGAAPSKPSRSTAARPSRPRAGVDRDADVLRVVQERPGVTVREVAEQLGVDASGLYRPVRRLQERGQIAKDGVRLRPTRQAAEPSGPQAAATRTAEHKQAAAQPDEDRPGTPAEQAAASD